MGELHCLGSIDLHNKLQRLYQGSKSVDDYFKKMEMTLMRAQIKESQETNMVQFLHEINREIQDVVELHRYSTLEELIHQATKPKANGEIELKFIPHPKPYKLQWFSENDELVVDKQVLVAFSNERYKDEIL
ncbi:hypothetical protein CR513_35259, partial [Mucuna pruriens]